jgi:photoactive yellow protein
VNAAELQQELEQRSAPGLDALPFGVIRLNAQGKVVYLSRTEARQSGFHKHAEGLSFFTELAPCMANPQFVARVEQARAASVLDVTFEQIGDFEDAERELCVRMLSASDRGIWVCLERTLQPGVGPTTH